MFEKLEGLVFNKTSTFYPILGPEQSAMKACFMDFSAGNTELEQYDLTDIEVFSQYVDNYLKIRGAQVGIGGYGENRVIYQKKNHFGLGAEARSIHLGVDIWCPAGTGIYAPLAATVHSFAFNNQPGDYGYTIILKHDVGSQKFYSLYGHLGSWAFDQLAVGQLIPAGQLFCRLGHVSENGGWPPHLHFQLIKDMAHYQGDYPGVCKPSEQAFYLHNCPDAGMFLDFVMV